MPPVQADLSFEEFLLLNQEGRIPKLRTDQQSVIDVELLPGISGRFRSSRVAKRDEDTGRSQVGEAARNLPDAARGDTEAERRLKDAVRSLVDRVIITPLSQERGGEIEITIEGTLQSLLSERLENVGLGALVAGGGYSTTAYFVHPMARVRL